MILLVLIGTSSNPSESPDRSYDVAQRWGPTNIDHALRPQGMLLSVPLRVSPSCLAVRADRQQASGVPTQPGTWAEEPSRSDVMSRLAGARARRLMLRRFAPRQTRCCAKRTVSSWRVLRRRARREPGPHHSAVSRADRTSSSATGLPSFSTCDGSFAQSCRSDPSCHRRGRTRPAWRHAATSFSIRARDQHRGDSARGIRRLSVLSDPVRRRAPSPGWIEACRRPGAVDRIRRQTARAPGTRARGDARACGRRSRSTRSGPGGASLGARGDVVLRTKSFRARTRNSRPQRRTGSQRMRS